MGSDGQPQPTTSDLQLAAEVDALLMAISFAYQDDWLGLRDADAAAPAKREAQ